MTKPDRDPIAAGRAWMRGELSSADYFALVRQHNQARETKRRLRWKWRRKAPRK